MSWFRKKRLTINVTRIAPGDVLIAQVNSPHLTASDAEAIKQRIHALLPELGVLVVGQNVELSVLRDERKTDIGNLRRLIEQDAIRNRRAS